VIPERSLSPTELDAVLAILAISFADPALVDVAADREPRTTLFVLRHLDLVAPDANERKKIGDTRTYVKQQFEKYRAKMNAEPAKNLR
jgi:hypothetical protein